MNGACTHAASVHGVGDESLSLRVELAMGAQRRVGQQGVERAARRLPLARREHALANDGRRFACGRFEQLCRGQRRYLELYINAIEHRSIDA